MDNTPRADHNIYTRTLGRTDSNDTDPATPASGSERATPTRPRSSFVSRLRTMSQGSAWRKLADEELASPGLVDKPPIPSALAPSGESLSTPLPILPMIVLSIVMLGEFLSANVSTPFLLFMVEGFGVLHEEADVGYWTGILVSCFFFTQFLTSLLWATVAEKHGTRAVLSASLLGSSLTCLAFGTSTSLPQAISIRLLQGVFAGAIGVGRGTVATITDPSNEGRAYAILGFCWGFGGVAGAIIGGSFESPAKKWPDVFGQSSLFAKYPYLLPTAIASSITLIGALLSLLLASDGGPREGAIRLPPEKVSAHETIEEELNITVEEVSTPGLLGVGQRLSRKVSGLFAKRVHDAHDTPSPSGSRPSVPVPLSTPMRRDSASRNRAFSRTSRTNGSAYGYGGGYRNRVTSNVNQSLAGRRGSLASTIARRRASHVHHPGDATDANQPIKGELNLAQRLLMANEFTVTNIADLWVAAAINADNESPFLSDSEADEDPFNEDDDEMGTQSPTRAGRSSATHMLGSSSPIGKGRPSSSAAHRYSARGARPSFASSSRQQNVSPLGHAGVSRDGARRVSSIPAIFSHTGIRSRPAETPTSPGHPLLVRDSGPPEEPQVESLAPIVEGQIQPASSPRRGRQEEEVRIHMTEKQPSLLSQLPLAIILQYGILALHSTTHDQVFLSYLVSKYPSGGLNLNAGHFAQLIALMSLASIFYQFFLYPNMGPPRGRFSHLSMFRIGSLLFIPAYLSVTLYRPLGSPNDDGNVILMAALAVSTAVRYAGITFAYTAISILLNYMSPPHILGYANGIAQSIVSFARFVGPVLGGYLWSKSVEVSASGYPLGFIVCASVTALAVAHSFFIR